MTKDKSPGVDGTVRRRSVFYISGYDPRGPAHYHKLYGDEAARQAKVNGHSFSVGPRRADGAIEAHWSVACGHVSTDYRFLRYDDIMRQRWSRNALTLIRDILRAFFPLLTRGVLPKVLGLSWPFFITLISPFLVLLLAILIAILAGTIVWILSTALAGIVAAVAVFIGLAALRSRLEQRIGAFWLARVFAFIVAQGGGTAPDIEARTDVFATRVAAAMTEAGADEVLLIGHSAGAQIAVAAAARALKALEGQSVHLSLMTLGHTIPLLALQPGAAKFRAELESLGADKRLTWIDFSAAIDGACFALTDPFAASGLTQPDPSQPVPKLLSTRFPKLFAPASYARLRRDFRRAHFQYLMAAELAGGYDYFLITAGDKSLGLRFGEFPSVANFNRFRFRRS